MNRSIVLFVAGIMVSVSAYAFFDRFMAMPEKAMMMGSMMIQGQSCDCTCKPE